MPSQDPELSNNRDKFEEWLCEAKQGFGLSRNGDVYQVGSVDLLWRAWEASREVQDESFNAWRAAQATASQWQPIETAPKDGDEILAWGPNGYEIAFWVDGEWCDAGYGLIHPTHWMPLPEPPRVPEPMAVGGGASGATSAAGALTKFGEPPK